MKSIVRPMLENHLRTVLGSLSVQEIDLNPEAFAATVEAAASPDLGKMGLSVVSCTIRPVRSG